ncbi:MAG: putative ATP-grasp-modified RiPP [Pseudonocardiaceae bacterium]
MRTASSAVDDLLGNEADGALGRVGERFPLGRGMRRCDLGGEAPSGPQTRPFGLRYVIPVERGTIKVIDLSRVTYDPDVQMSRLGGKLFVHAGTKEATQNPYDTREDDQIFPDTDPDEVYD